MTINIKVITFQDEKNDTNESYTATKWLTISDSKTDDDYVKEAYDAIKDDITVWQNSKKNIGKTFNPDTGKIE